MTASDAGECRLHPRSPEQEAADLALRSALHLRPADLSANRSGSASRRQRRRLVRDGLWSFLALLLLTPLSLFTMVKTAAHPELGIGFAALACCATTAVCAWLAKKTALDALLGEIDTAVGYVRFTYYGEAEAAAVVAPDASSVIGIQPSRGRHDSRCPPLPAGAVTFDVSLARVQVFQPTVRYRVYVFRRSRALAGAEVEP